MCVHACARARAGVSVCDQKPIPVLDGVFSQGDGYSGRRHKDGGLVQPTAVPTSLRKGNLAQAWVLAILQMSSL